MELQSRPEALAVELARHQVGGRGPRARSGGLRAPEPGVLFLVVAGSARLKVPRKGSFSSLPRRWGEFLRPGPLAPPGSSSSLLSCNLAQFWGGGVRRLWDLSPASSLSPRRVCRTEGARRGPLREPAPGCLCESVDRPPPGPHPRATPHSLQK